MEMYEKIERYFGGELVEGMLFKKKFLLEEESSNLFYIVVKDKSKVSTFLKDNGYSESKVGKMYFKYIKSGEDPITLIEWDISKFKEAEKNLCYKLYNSNKLEDLKTLRMVIDNKIKKIEKEEEEWVKSYKQLR